MALFKESRKNKFLRRFAKFLTEEYGPRCSVREPGCRCCELWAAFDLIDTMLIDDEGESATGAAFK